MRVINRIVEPKRLLLVWQAPDKASDQATGERFIVGEIHNIEGKVFLQYRDNPDIVRARTLGFTGLTTYPYDTNRKFDDNLIDVLSKRLPPVSRTDYNDYLSSYRIEPQAAKGIPVLSLLGYTTGKLAGDGFSFLHTFDDATPPFDFTFEIAGFRHHGLSRFPDPKVLQDKEVTFAYEKDNLCDKDAVAVMYDNTRLGYVPKGFTGILKKILEQYAVSAFAERINGTPARPSILIFVEVR